MEPGEAGELDVALTETLQPAATFPHEQDGTCSVAAVETGGSTGHAGHRLTLTQHHFTDVHRKGCCIEGNKHV